MDAAYQWVEKVLGIGRDVQTKLYITVITLLALWMIRRIILWIVLRRVDDLAARYRWQKATGYITIVLALVLIGRVWIQGLQAAVTYFGLVSAGLVIVLKDPIINFAGWIFILARRPFEVGDRIEIGAIAGDVIDLRVFQFTLAEIRNWVGADQSTGRIVHIPNAKVFTETLANFSKGFRYIWNEIPVLITFESDWKKAKDILQRIASSDADRLSASAARRVRESARRYLMIFTQLTPTVYTSVKESGVLLTIRYLCEPRQRRDSEQAMWEDILHEFAQNETIEFAYPTRRFYQRHIEAKDAGVESADEGAGEDAEGETSL